MAKPSKVSKSRDGKIDPLPRTVGAGRNDVTTMTSGHSQYLLYSLQLSVLDHRGTGEFLSIRDRLGLKYQAYAGGTTLKF